MPVAKLKEASGATVITWLDGVGGEHAHALHGIRIATKTPDGWQLTAPKGEPVPAETAEAFEKMPLGVNYTSDADRPWTAADEEQAAGERMRTIQENARRGGGS